MAKKTIRTMNDTEKCVANIGNRFNLILVASQRVRELRRGQRALVDNSNDSSTIVLALKEIEAGKITAEYLKRVK